MQVGVPCMCVLALLYCGVVYWVICWCRKYRFVCEGRYLWIDGWCRWLSGLFVLSVGLCGGSWRFVFCCTYVCRGLSGVIGFVSCMCGGKLLSAMVCHVELLV